MRLNSAIGLVIGIKPPVSSLGFERAAAAETGRPGYDPRDLLKLYLYGYLHTIRSSRRPSNHIISTLRRHSVSSRQLIHERVNHTAHVIGRNKIIQHHRKQRTLIPSLASNVAHE